MRIGLVALVCAALILAVPGTDSGPAASAGAAAAAYRFTDLGQPGEANSDAVALDDAGAVLLAVTPADGGLRAALWRGGARADLGVPPGHTDFSPADLDAAGAVAGTAYDAAGRGHPFLWRDGAWADLGLPSGYDSLQVIGLGDGGHVAGWASAPGPGAQHGFLWHAATGWVDLGADTLPEAVDAAGRVAGSATVAGGTSRAAVWRAGAGWADLGVLAGTRSHARGLGDDGRVAGWSTYSDYPFGRRAVLWQDGAVADLGTLPVLDQSEATALNDAGQVVGTAYRDGRGDPGHRAFLWRDGALADLNALLAPGSGWTLERATGINARGQIVGSGRYAGQRRAFLLTPPGLAPGPSPSPSPSPSPGPSASPAPSPSASPTPLPCASPFADVADGDAACAAIVALTGAGIIRGYATTPPTFGPDDDVQRAQLAAFLVRALGWEGRPTGPRTFADFGQLTGELRAASLSVANACADPADAATCVARGYGDGRFGPNDPVSHAQVIAFVARAFALAPHTAWAPGAPPAGVPAAHAADIGTYLANGGAIPDAPTTADDWNAPAPRAWVAMVLSQALQSQP